MRILVAAVGRLRDGADAVLVERYVDRTRAAGRAIALGPVTVIEAPESRAESAELRRADEARRLLIATRSAGIRVVLDMEGKFLSSDVFARWIAARRDGGARDLAFLVGGPDGHGREVLDAADLILSLGPMTLPHGLARVVLAEQLYRAATILSGHPYHR